MPKFGNKSKMHLATLHRNLQWLMNEAIKHIDFSILEGHRTEERQKELYDSGKSKTMHSKHLTSPSMAVDIAPYPYPKTEKGLNQLYYLIGLIKGLAIGGGLKIRLGSDWNRDNDIRNDKFQDAWHIELEV